MKTQFYSLAFISLCFFLISSCTFRLVDFTVISSKNVSLNIDKTQGKRTEAKKSYFLGIGWNIKDSMDKALEKAGMEYDILVDGVVQYTNFPFVLTVKVEGVAMSSNKIKQSMGAVQYEEWLKDQNVFDPENPSIVKSE